MTHAGHFKPSKAAFTISSLRSECPSRWPTLSTLLPPVTPTALTSLLQSWKMSLVRILQEESTIVCFMVLLWQVAGDESSGTWGPDGPKQSTQKDPRDPLPEPSHLPPVVHMETPDVLSWCQHIAGSLSRNSQSPQGLPPLGGCCW